MSPSGQSIYPIYPNLRFLWEQNSVRLQAKHFNGLLDGALFFLFATDNNIKQIQPFPSQLNCRVGRADDQHQPSCQWTGTNTRGVWSQKALN